MSRPLIELEDVHVRFRSRTSQRFSPVVEAVCGVSLSLDPGESFAIVGESGSGKTTLARTMLGLIPIHQGTIRFRGTEIKGNSDRTWRPYRRHMAILFQDPIGSLSPRRPVADLLREARSLSASGHRTSVRDLLAQVGLSATIAQRYPHQLSGGQARRVSIARALALRPRLLVADEPTAGLDVSIQSEILDLLAQSRQEYEMSLLIITHNLAIVRHVAERMAVMYLGRWVEEGPTTELLERPRHPYTRALLTAQSGSLAHDMIGDAASVTNRPPGCEFHPRCPAAKPSCRIDVPHRTQLGTGRSIRCHFPLD